MTSTSRKGATIATDLFSATRLTNSTNGNPRFDLHTSDGTYRTQSDAACSYDVDNVTRSIPRGETIPVRLSLTPAGRVWNIERPTVATRVRFRVGTERRTVETVLHLTSTDDDYAMRRKIAATGLTSPHQFPPSAVRIVSAEPIPAVRNCADCDDEIEAADVVMVDGKPFHEEHAPEPAGL